ncbi:MAG: hypothetical protein J6S76_07360 [Clostridia bacterium]|nr:hypothetical protein [Clostridia bacterium]
MKVEFRVDWGYVYLYLEDDYLPIYKWDGHLTCDKGTIEEIYYLEYPFVRFGPLRDAIETKLDKPEWKSETRRRLAGIRVCAEVEEDSVFTLHTMMGSFAFEARQILEQGRLEFPVAPKYFGCAVTVTRKDFVWFRPAVKDGEAFLGASELGLPVKHRCRMELGWLAPHTRAVFPVEVCETSSDYAETLIQISGMIANAQDEDGDAGVAWGEIPFALYCDGQKIREFFRRYRHHDGCVQMMEDHWERVQLQPGAHVLELENLSDAYALGINNIVIKQCEYQHGQLSIPEWVLKSERLFGKVFAVRQDDICVSINGCAQQTVCCQPGWNEFAIEATKIGENTIRTHAGSTTVTVYDIEEEPIPVKVGYDMTVVPHDDSGYMDWLLDYTYRTRLCNFVSFRDFYGARTTAEEHEARIRHWGAFCKEHELYVSAQMDHLYRPLVASAGDMLDEAGSHEHSGTVVWYAANFPPEGSAKDTKDASEQFTAYMKAEIDKLRKLTDGKMRIGFGDSGMGIKYSYLAGIDFIRAETMGGDTTALLSTVRGASNALKDGRWGVHIAIQHYYTPYKETHLGQYFLSLMQPWLMGAETIYEEDSLFSLFKEERQTWRDALTKGKRDMTRSFFKFVKTHPRRGTLIRNLAVLEGRYAASNYSAVIEEDKKRHLWGHISDGSPEWAYMQPEKYRHVIEVLTPGADATPLRQQYDKKHIFFAGTPYGDFDTIPIESTADFMCNYKLLLNLGWNTMIEEDYQKLRKYVENGGILLTGLPEMSTHVSRKFLLQDLDDLALWNDGDLSELCGIKVNGKGKRYSGQWMCKDWHTMQEPELSAAPYKSEDEDGEPILADIELCGAEVVAWDQDNGQPMLVRNRIGDGWVYLFTLWAYPGHNKFQKFCACWTELLAKNSMSDTYVVDESGEVFWNVWEDGDEKTVKMLNTDWTTKGNVKTVTVVSGACAERVEIRERTLVCAKIKDDHMTVETFEL